MANIHRGSWFGLPDIGLTEKLGSVLGRGVTAQGGSNIIGRSSAQTPSSNRTPTVNTNVMGVSTSQAGGYPAVTGGYPTTSSSSGGGGGGGGGSQSFAPAFNMAAAFESAPDAPNIDFDSLIAPALDALGQAEGAAQSVYGANVAEIEQGQQNAKAQQQTYITGQEKEATSSRARQKQTSEDALTGARQAYSEISQGIQSRFGGTTGTGAFATEITGRQTLQNIGQIRQQLTAALGEIDNRLSQVKEIGQLALQDIDQKAEVQKQQAKAQLDETINNIRMRKGELLTRKAEMVQQALQGYQQLLAETNARNAQFKQQIAIRQYDAEQQLKSAQSRASEIAKSFSVDQILPTVQSLQQYFPGSEFTGNIKPGEAGGQISSLGFTLKDKKQQEEDDNAPITF